MITSWAVCQPLRGLFQARQSITGQVVCPKLGGVSQAGWIERGKEEGKKHGRGDGHHREGKESERSMGGAKESTENETIHRAALV